MSLADAATSRSRGWGLVGAVLSASSDTALEPKQINELDRRCILDLVEKVAQTTKDLCKADITPPDRQNLLVELDARVNTLKTTVKKLL